MLRLNESHGFSYYIKRARIFQFFAGCVFFISGLVVNFLQLLSACVIWPFNRVLYRKINYFLATIIWSQMTFYYQWWSNSELVLYIKPEDLENLRKENSIWLGNHRYEVDWLLGWIVAQRLGFVGSTKIFGKQSLRLLPIIGWCWYFTESIFLKRAWNTDKQILEHDIKQLVHDYPEGYNFVLFFSCEGTRYSEEKRLESMIVAREKGLPELKYHILPRTKGFVTVMKGIHNHVTALYDMTVGFPEVNKPKLANLLLGQQYRAEAFIRRIPIDEVPYDDEEKCAQFVHKMFQEKDKTFEYFAKHQTFQGAGNPKLENFHRTKQDLCIQTICLIVVGLPSIQLFIKFLCYASTFMKILFLLIVIGGTLCILFLIRSSKASKAGRKSIKDK